jgi:hypothetical protein
MMSTGQMVDHEIVSIDPRTNFPHGRSFRRKVTSADIKNIRNEITGLQKAEGIVGRYFVESVEKMRQWENEASEKEQQAWRESLDRQLRAKYSHFGAGAEKPKNVKIRFSNE